MSITTSYQDLNNIFNHNIRAKDLAEFLVSFDYDQPAKSVKEVMKGKGFSVVGVRKYGDVIGFVNVDELNNNEGKHFIYFDDVLCTGNTYYQDIKDFLCLKDKRGQEYYKKILEYGSNKIVICTFYEI